MEEITEEQMQTLRDDILSGLVMNVTTKHFRELEAELATYKAGNVPVTQILADNEGLANDIEELQSELAALKEQVRWIPVGEGLPENDEGECLWCCNISDMEILMFGTIELFNADDYIFTHWMPIPQLPKDDHGKE